MRMSIQGALINGNKELIFQAQSLGGFLQLIVPINGFPAEGAITQITISSASAFDSNTKVSIFNNLCGVGTVLYTPVNNFITMPLYTAAPNSTTSSLFGSQTVYNFNPPVNVYNSELVNQLYILIEGTSIFPAINIEVRGFARLASPLLGVDRTQGLPSATGNYARGYQTWWRVLSETSATAALGPGSSPALHDITGNTGRGFISNRRNLTPVPLNPDVDQNLVYTQGIHTAFYFGGVRKIKRFFIDFGKDNAYSDATITFTYSNGTSFVGFTTVYYGTRGATSGLQMCYSGVIHLSDQSDWTPFLFSTDPMVVQQNTIETNASVSGSYKGNFFYNPNLYWIKAQIGLTTANAQVPIISILPLHEDF